jgi:hypothetical protein
MTDSQPSFRRIKKKPKQLRRIEDDKSEILENIEEETDVM